MVPGDHKILLSPIYKRPAWVLYRVLFIFDQVRVSGAVGLCSFTLECREVLRPYKNKPGVDRGACLHNSQAIEQVVVIVVEPDAKADGQPSRHPRCHHLAVGDWGAK